MSLGIPRTQRSLEIGLSVTPTLDCPVRELAPEVTEVHHQASEDGLQCEIVCSSPQTDSVTRYHSFNDDTKPCPATVFMKHDTVLNVEQVQADSLLIVTHPPSRDAVQELVEDLRTVSDRVEIRWVSDESDSRDRSTRSVDTDLLTEKQREAVQLAVESGYYSQPRETTLSELAESVGISQSAMSQRLHAAEQKLLEGLFST